MAFEKPSLKRVIDGAIVSFFNKVNFCIPGIVTRYDKETQSVDVNLNKCAPNLLDKNFSMNIKIPPLLDVPVIFFRTSDTYIHAPLDAGDGVIVFFSDVDLDSWKIDSSTPRSFSGIRRNDLSDALAFPGGYGAQNLLSDLSDDLEIQHKTSKVSLGETTLVVEKEGSTITIKESGDIELKRGETVLSVNNSGKITVKNAAFNLKDQLTDLISQIANLTVVTASPGSPSPVNPTQQVSLNLLSSQIEGLLE